MIASKKYWFVFMLLVSTNVLAHSFGVTLVEIDSSPTYLIETKIRYDGIHTTNKAALKAKGQLLKYLKRENKTISHINLTHFNHINTTRNGQNVIYQFKIRQSDIHY